MLTHLGLFYAEGLGNCIHWIFILLFLCSCFLKVFFCTWSYWIWIIFKQVYLTRSILTCTTTLGQSGPRIIGNVHYQMQFNIKPSTPIFCGERFDLFAGDKTAYSKPCQQRQTDSLGGKLQLKYSDLPEDKINGNKMMIIKDKWNERTDIFRSKQRIYLCLDHTFLSRLSVFENWNFIEVGN